MFTDILLSLIHIFAIDSTLTASYYIGATWLVERELPVIVLPKIPNIDYLETVSYTHLISKCVR